MKSKKEKGVVVIEKQINETPSEKSSMTVYNETLYIFDGKTLYSMYIPKETIWFKIKEFFKSLTQTN